MSSYSMDPHKGDETARREAKAQGQYIRHEMNMKQAVVLFQVMNKLTGNHIEINISGKFEYSAEGKVEKIKNDFTYRSKVIFEGGSTFTLGGENIQWEVTRETETLIEMKSSYYGDCIKVFIRVSEEE